MEPATWILLASTLIYAFTDISIDCEIVNEKPPVELVEEEL